MDEQKIIELLRSINSKLEYIGTKINNHTGNLDKKLDQIIDLLSAMTPEL